VLRAELLERYSQVRFNDDGQVLHGASLVDFARGHRKLITALERVDDAILERLPELEVISKYGVGIDMLDVRAMARRGVRLGWTGGVNRRSVAELALGFMLALLRQVPAANLDLRAGRWQNRLGRQLTGLTVGIVGCGHVGKDLARLLRPFQCRILAHDLLEFPEFYAEYGIEPAALSDLLRRADVVTLHVPFDASTANLLSAGRLALMKRDAVLINTARGGIVDEAAVKRMLIDGALAGAAFDVFAIEPPADPELLQLPNVLATPHIGGSSAEAVLAMGRAAIAGLDQNAVPHPD
jgi:D-3-phosphoglycerate dehydrogenase